MRTTEEGGRRESTGGREEMGDGGERVPDSGWGKRARVEEDQSGGNHAEGETGSSEAEQKKIKLMEEAAGELFGAGGIERSGTTSGILNLVDGYDSD